MSDTRHQCRYCAYCVFTIDDEWWCDEKNEYISRPKRPNACPKWLFNAIAADNLNKTFSPRPRRTDCVQLKFDFMERKKPK